MQIKLITIPASGNKATEEEMNRFLRGHRILDVSHEFVQNGMNSCWCFCIRYLESYVKVNNQGNQRNRVDYKEVLDEAAFKVFTRLRECRKRIALDEGIPAYAVFTDKEMAEVAKLEDLTAQGMIKVQGIGKNKVERFGKRMIEMFQGIGPNETSQ